MKTTRIDEYICLDVDQIIVEEMEELLGLPMTKDWGLMERNKMAKLKRAARTVLASYRIGPRWQ